MHTSTREKESFLFQAHNGDTGTEKKQHKKNKRDYNEESFRLTKKFFKKNLAENKSFIMELRDCFIASKHNHHYRLYQR